MWEFISKGGFLIYPLLLCSIVSLAVIIERFISLRKFYRSLNLFLDQFNRSLAEKNFSEALKLCETSKSLLARIYQRGLNTYQSQSRTETDADINKETVRQTMQEIATLELPLLDKNLKILSNIAHIAPLLGFLGTVVGMIKAFKDIQNLAALGEAIGPGSLAGGIWEALITTAIGLSIAIPTYLAHSYFSNYVDKLINHMEKNTSEMLEKL